MAVVYPGSQYPTIPVDAEATVARTVLGTEAQGVAGVALHLSQYRFRRAVVSHAYHDLSGGPIQYSSPLALVSPVRAVWRCSPRAEVVVVFVDVQCAAAAYLTGTPTLDVQLEDLTGATVHDAGYQLAEADGSLPSAVESVGDVPRWPQMLISSGERRDATATFARALEIPLAQRGAVVAVRATPNDVRIVSLTAVEGFLPAASQVM